MLGACWARCSGERGRNVCASAAVHSKTAPTAASARGSAKAGMEPTVSRHSRALTAAKIAAARFKTGRERPLSKRDTGLFQDTPMAESPHRSIAGNSSMWLMTTLEPSMANSPPTV